MPRELWMSSLTEPQCQLVELFQSIRFGRIERLAVRDRQPVLDPMPRIFCDRKLGSPEDGPQEPERGDYPLKAQVIELFEEMTRLRDGVIEDLTIKHGLPFSMVVEETDLFERVALQHGRRR